jgi:uncharacterized protein YcbK (DUF882 family)
MTPADWQLLHHFTPAEFTDPDKMGFQFMLKLDSLRREAGVPCPVTSSYRTPLHNRQVGGAKDSAHCDEVCESVDVAPLNAADAFQILRAAFLVGFERIGVYANGSFHFDTTGDRRPNCVLWHVVSNPA